MDEAKLGRAAYDAFQRAVGTDVARAVWDALEKKNGVSPVQEIWIKVAKAVIAEAVAQQKRQRPAQPLTRKP